MGYAARNRGNYNQRKEQAITRRLESAEREEKKRLEKLRTRTPEERAAAIKTKQIMAMTSLWRGNYGAW